MKHYIARFFLFVLCLSCMSIGTAHAWGTKAFVYCDANSNGSIDSTDLPMANIGVNLFNTDGSYDSYKVTGADGGVYFGLFPYTETYTETLDLATLPSDGVILQPPGGQYSFEKTESGTNTHRDWLIDSAICKPVVEGKCWLTGGGVKFSSITDTLVAEKGPKHNMGGNVFPSCDPAPGDGGQWNHIAHNLKLHFLGTSIDTVACGNVPGIEPGSESPVTPYNYIEYQGTGTLKGIKGNKVDHGTVYFFARAEDRNEPGSGGAADGEDIDRYFIHVFSDPANPAGTTLMLLDVDGDSTTVDPVSITGGNLQLHVSSCDNPPTP